MLKYGPVPYLDLELTIHVIKIQIHLVIQSLEEGPPYPFVTVHECGKRDKNYLDLLS
jgi:hypothetical protein